MTETPAIGSPARTQAILNRYHLSAKKSLGQNFLTDLNTLVGIVDAAEITTNDNVIEIGPGIGSLTEQLAKRANKVVAYELDQNLLPVLDDTLHQYDNVKIINQDILKANLPEMIEKEFGDDKPIKVVANLPYYITTPIILSLLKGPVDFSKIVVMMQKEVADRLCAKTGVKAYSSLSVIVQYLHRVTVPMLVSRKSFIPSPNVDSAIVTLSSYDHRDVVAFNDKSFMGFVRGCFAHRRKTLWNNLQSVFGKSPETKEQIKAGLAQMEIDPGVRPERLTVSDFVKLANTYHQIGILK
ncbi:16S rRNA (adenine(1518)-N(6)/adenine(1519)-N(6))-dimethyltransferase RsmA [Lactobacillus sp. Sy-1]|uniref:16S rRNA (adenine(1518)-N(6)/adenine(1519)-N(6))- dimethyltransferase RsmA n=1 Tax=Lactobacillus sp. Sy-1 TaxID=2109645 RepID=UPI001C560EA7|nr:16S rRNA (adenine(1518)-N(6)/adenine(1519)-N(6))-dimethyltransferase RsmA [Lactobacillus sp. Sy-1]MBW1604806.1 16S rRNA (adenine(1518)-N(6)/adenine(1519)-N(6))-dimethyltransferase RsmA [Lactobacillus sp. Sy-1]